MKFSLCFELFLVATVLPEWLSCNCNVEAGSSTTIESTKRLRGKPVVHTRKVYNTEEELHENLVDSHHHQTMKLRGSGKNGKPMDITLDLTALENFFVEEDNYPLNQHNNTDESTEDYDHFQNIELIDAQEQTVEEATHQPRRHDKSLHILPTGENTYNHSLFEELHSAPFEIYESSLGQGKEEREDSFPVFIVPDWKRDTTGVFSGFSRTATPLAFQNIQFLLSWDDIVEASTGAEDSLVDFLDESNFEASLFIGKTLGAESHVPFLGLMVSYEQRSQKNVMIPFAKLENFFHDTSEKHLLSDSIKHLEHDALHGMLDEERSSSKSSNNATNSFFHHEIIHGTNQKEQLEDIEAIHFRRLFQLLIRRTFLFSFGYADCLKVEPHNLRQCLDDTFSLVVQMEASIRGALDDLLVEELGSVTKTNSSSRVSEACISASSGSYGTGDCSAFEGLGGVGVSSFSTLSSSTFR
ncbi:MAG: hypothetical protein ACI8RD_001608 [Bacillariaceae sp.]|jgi:hypothetical protein